MAERQITLQVKVLMGGATIAADKDVAEALLNLEARFNREISPYRIQFGEFHTTVDEPVVRRRIRTPKVVAEPEQALAVAKGKIVKTKNTEVQLPLAEADEL